MSGRVLVSDAVRLRSSSPLPSASHQGMSASAFCQSTNVPDASAVHCTRGSTDPDRPAGSRSSYHPSGIRWRSIELRRRPLRVIDQGIGSVVAGESGGTSHWSHGLGYLFSALRRDGLIPDKLSLNLSTLLRSLNLFLKLRVWTVPHSLTTNQPRHSGKQDKHGPELSRFHSSKGIHGKRRAKSSNGQVRRLLDIFTGAASFESCVLRPTWASYS